MMMMMFYQASGRPSGNHGLYHRYRIEALTMRGRGENWEYGRGFLETGKYVHVINNKQLLDELFVISGIIKVEVSVIGRG